MWLLTTAAAFWLSADKTKFQLLSHSEGTHENIFFYVVDMVSHNAHNPEKAKI
jgi:hypothetical protein